MNVYFFGVRPGDSAGHFLHTEHYQTLYTSSPIRTPWGGETWPLLETEALWDAFAPGKKPRSPYQVPSPQPEGQPAFARRDGWTLVALWDRSADRRGGCCALFPMDADIPDQEALAAAKERFPAVFARIEKHLGRQVEL